MAGSTPKRENESRHRAAGDSTVGELCEKWFSQVEPDLSPSVAPQYRTLLDNRILPKWGHTPVRGLRTFDLDEWYAELRRKGRLDGLGGLSANSVKRIHSVLRRALAQGVKWGLLETNPAADATVPKVHRRPMRLPEPADVARLITDAEQVNPSLPIYLRLAAATGARRGEMCALRWRDVDFARRRLTIAHSIVEREGELIEKDTKTHQVRRVSLDEATMTVLEQHRSRRHLLAAGHKTELTSDAFLFSHEVDSSRPWRPNYVTLAFGRLRDRLGLDGVRLHHLRHFSASQLLAAGIDVRTVSGRLGHANASTTLDIYAQFVEQADERAAAALGIRLPPARPTETDIRCTDCGPDHRATVSDS
jgi:integrase